MSPLKVLTNMNLLPSVNKGRKPKFELHLKIYDLNNVPLVSGGSMVKWHISHSMHAEHRGRTQKCPISNHKVEFNYAKAVGHIRIGLDKFNNLTECPIEFEVVQEFPSSGRDEKISLGFVRLNLSEYVEESETIGRDAVPRTSRDGGSFDRGHFRKHRSTRSTSSTQGHANAESASTSSRPTSSSGTPAAESEEPDVEEGIIRRYLMQDSKINSTLKIGILMIQIDGDKNFIAPALKTAPVFGGIAGIMVGEQVEQDEAGQPPTVAKSRDMAEVQDMYRISLAASWVRQPGELPPDQCIEDIFAGGDGWSAEMSPHASAQDPSPQRKPSQASDRSTSSSGRQDSRSLPKEISTFDGAYSSDDGGESPGGNGGDTLRPRDWRRFRKHHQQQQPGSQNPHQGHSLLHAFSPQHNLLRPRDSRHGSSASEKSTSTATVTGRNNPGASASPSPSPHLGTSDSGAFSTSPFPSFSSLHVRSGSRHRREDSGASSRDEHMASDQRSRRGSLTSLAPTMGSGSSGRRDAGGIGGGYRKARELEEFEVRDDMVAWRLPGAVR